MDNLIQDFKETVESTMNVYQKAFKEGRKIGFGEGYRQAHQEYKGLLDNPPTNHVEINPS